MLARWPPALAAEHDAIGAVMDQHDDRRVGAWKARCGAVRVEAEADMPRFPDCRRAAAAAAEEVPRVPGHDAPRHLFRSEEHTSELQSLMRTPYAVLCLKKKKNTITKDTTQGI